VVLEGKLEVVVNEPDGTPDVLSELTPGSSIGELSLLTGLPRRVTVTALEDSTLLELTRAGFDRLAEVRPAEMAALATAILPRVQEHLLAGALTSVFEGLEPDVRNHLRSALEWHHLPSGETLFEEGDPSDALYIVVNGRLMVTASDGDGDTIFVGEISRGESIGEIGLVTGEPRTVSAYAVRDTDLARLSRAAFERLFERYPLTMLQLVRPIVKRSRPQTGAVAIKAGSVSAFAVLPAGPNVPLDDFTADLVAALERLGPTLHLSSERLDGMLGTSDVSQTPADDPAALSLVSWLNEQETRYTYIVYQADSEWTEWTSRCIRQTDRTLIVALAEGDPLPGRLETALHDMRSTGHTELVLLHPPACECPSGTRAWLEPRKVVAHHHVRREDEGHLNRLARRLTGHALGLVLGGGGARGLAHIGAIHALEEAGIEIDLVGGTSIGGMVGGAYALGMDYQGMIKLARMFGERKHFVDYTFPMVSFFSSHKISALLQKIYGDVYIEDLWRPFFCVSSNLTQAKPMVHRQGPLWKYVRATIALPAIFTPVSDAGELLSTAQ
jgi:NTE family protein/lysophospholipid hydrolase